MKKYSTNQERTSEYSKIFTRQKVLSLLVENETPLIFDVGANNGRSLNEFKQWWPQSEVHCFEPQEECWAELESCATRYSKTIINIYDRPEHLHSGKTPVNVLLENVITSLSLNYDYFVQNTLL